MRMSRHLGQTLRAAPSEAETPGYALLLRAGYIRQLASGIFSLLPLGLRVSRKIESILRQEMDAIDGEEIAMPVAHPAELWEETGRWSEVGDEMIRFEDRAGRRFCLAMTHEEVVTDLARRDVSSYRQLPLMVYQFQTKFRDEPRARAGLIRVREFLMKDSYSLDRDLAGLQQQYENHYNAYTRIFQRCGLPDVIAVQADTGMMGGKLAHEFMYLNPIGEDTLAICDSCGDAANLQVARFRKPLPEPEDGLAVERVATPECRTIESLAAYLKVPASRTCKVVFQTERLRDTEATTVVMALVRGDMEVNETKLAQVAGATILRPSTIDEIEGIGAVAGYASPIGIRREGVCVIADDLVMASPNLVSGANEPGYHLRNVNAGRDFIPDRVADITSAFAGAGCEKCGGPLRLVRGVEVGNIFQLGTRYSEVMGATYLDEHGQSQPIWMGSYGIGVGRLLGCLAEARHDERGLTWPSAVAPFAVHLVRLSSGGDSIESTADRLYEELLAAGIEVLYDDRALSPGVKFADADLIGIPNRVTVSARSIQAGGVEIKRRTEAQPTILPEQGALEIFKGAGA